MDGYDPAYAHQSYRRTVCSRGHCWRRSRSRSPSCSLSLSLSLSLQVSAVLFFFIINANMFRNQTQSISMTTLDSMPHKHKVVIAGNHDITLDPEYYADSFARFHFKGKQDDAAAVAAMRECAAFAYLEDGSTTICGYSVYGSPWQPEFCDWAFNLERGEPCARRWRAIPDETEILVTHGPPVGHGDLCKGSSQRAGCVDLLAEITNRVKPLYHVFGHVHEGYGQTTDGTTNYINASTCTFNYRPTNKPIVFDLPNKPTE